MFETITPIDNSVLLKREYATEEDIETSLSNSYSAREHWKNISLEAVSYTHLTLPTSPHV